MAMRIGMFLLVGLLCCGCTNKDSLEIFEDGRGSKFYLIEASLIGNQGYLPFNNESVTDTHRRYYTGGKNLGRQNLG
jgi:hypothetical protein